MKIELVGMLHTDAIKRKLGISGIGISVSSWIYTPPKDYITRSGFLEK